jgi:hypothetical protein
MGTHAEGFFQVPGMVQECQNLECIVLQTEEDAHPHVVNPRFLRPVEGQDLPFIIPFGTLMDRLMVFAQKLLAPGPQPKHPGEGHFSSLCFPQFPDQGRADLDSLHHAQLPGQRSEFIRGPVNDQGNDGNISLPVGQAQSSGDDFAVLAEDRIERSASASLAGKNKVLSAGC